MKYITVTIVMKEDPEEVSKIIIEEEGNTIEVYNNFGYTPTRLINKTLQSVRGLHMIK